MGRIRTVKPEFWSDEFIGTLPLEARLLYIALWNFADDTGRFRANPSLVRAQIFPYDDDAISSAQVGLWLDLLAQAKRVTLYEHNGQRYGEIRPESWSHQKIDKAQPSKFPAPYDEGSNILGPFDDHSTNVPRTLPEHSTGDRIGREGIGEEGTGPAGADPPAASVGKAGPIPPEPLRLLSQEPPVPKLTPHRVLELWREVLVPPLPNPKGLGPKREKQLRAIMRPERDEAWWRGYFEAIRGSPALMGRNARRWKADIDFAVRSDDIVNRVFEGKYLRVWGEEETAEDEIWTTD